MRYPFLRCKLHEQMASWNSAFRSTSNRSNSLLWTVPNSKVIYIPGYIKDNIFPAGRLGLAFFATGPDWVLKCISFWHSNLLYWKKSYIPSFSSPENILSIWRFCLNIINIITRNLIFELLLRDWRWQNNLFNVLHHFGKCHFVIGNQISSITKCRSSRQYKGRLRYTHK